MPGVNLCTNQFELLSYPRLLRNRNMRPPARSHLNPKVARACAVLALSALFMGLVGAPLFDGQGSLRQVAGEKARRIAPLLDLFASEALTLTETLAERSAGRRPVDDLPDVCRRITSWSETFSGE